MTTEDVQDFTEPQEAEQAPVIAEPPRSRFLFVDIAALRAKQLRRGALPRLDAATIHLPHKAERVAMEEVKGGLVAYDLPEFKPRTATPD